MPSPGDSRHGDRFDRADTPGRGLFATGAILAGLAVALGAFGTHALETRVPSGRLATWETGVRYHLVHALALLALGLARSRWPARGIGRAGTLIALGTVVFSGSLYVLVLTDTPVLGAVTPLGGLLLIAGWALAAWAVLAASSPALPPEPPGPR